MLKRHLVILRAGLLAVAVLAAPCALGNISTVTKSFSPATITAGGTSTLTITIQNSPPGNPASIAFTDNYPAGLTNSSAAAAAQCNGTATGAAGGTSLSLTGGSINGNNSCTVTVTVTACTAGTLTNASFTVTSTTNSVASNAATLTVTAGAVSAATSTVSASPASIAADGTTTSTITVTLKDACGNGVSGKTVTLATSGGSSTISPASAVTNASGVASFTVKDGVAEGPITYTATDSTDGVTITQTAQVTFTRISAPTVAKSFSPTTITTGGTSTLTITITNPNAAAITGVAFTDTYPAGLTNSVAAASSQCGGTVTGTAGGGTLSLTGGSVAGSASCTVTATVTATTAGSYTNGTGSVTSGNASAGASASATLTVNAVSSFNAVEPGASATTGKVFTKISGQNFALDIVALDASNAIATGFTGTVAVEVVDNTSGGACNTLPVIATFTSQTFVSGDSGRHALTAGNAVGNVYRNARIRVKYPTTSPTITSCSGDNFAIRPGSLGFSVTDANRTTAGTTNTLNNTAIGGATVHNAGRPFTITVTAYNFDGVTVATNYDPTSYGGPTALALATCGGTACTATFGTLTPGTWSASGGVVTTTTASYSDVGAFNLQFQDASFATVDSSDGSSYVIGSTATGTGRFVPDRFVLSATSITPRSDLAGCAASAFTYMNEKMSANFTLTAVNAAGATTALYAGSLARLTLTSAASYSFGAIDSAAPTPLTARVDTTMIPTVSASWASGVATVAAPIAIQRSASPDGPYGSLNIGIAPSDPDSVALAAAALNLDADNNGIPERAQVGATTAVRFGRLRVLDISGSAKASLPVRMRTEYWNGTAFAVNSSDGCTQVNRINVAMTFQTLGTCATALTAATSTPVTFSSGTASPMLSAPNANGSTDLRVNLAASTGSACNPGSVAATNAALPYLQGRWTGAGTYTDDPVARATFGVYGQDRLPNNVIFRRENF